MTEMNSMLQQLQVKEPLLIYDRKLMRYLRGYESRSDLDHSAADSKFGYGIAQ